MAKRKIIVTDDKPLEERYVDTPAPVAPPEPPKPAPQSNVKPIAPGTPLIKSEEYHDAVNAFMIKKAQEQIKQTGIGVSAALEKLMKQKINMEGFKVNIDGMPVNQGWSSADAVAAFAGMPMIKQKLPVVPATLFDPVAKKEPTKPIKVYCGLVGERKTVGPDRGFCLICTRTSPSTYQLLYSSSLERWESGVKAGSEIQVKALDVFGVVQHVTVQLYQFPPPEET